MTSNNYWETEISTTTENEIRIRGYDLTEMIGAIPFSQLVYLMFKGELPSPAIGQVMDALLVASIDHGPGSPSVLAARTAASGGAPLKNAAMAGLLALDRFHGAAIEECMGILNRVVLLSQVEFRGSNIDQAAEIVVKKIRGNGERVPGFGHRQHLQDPRVNKLFDMTLKAGVQGAHIQAALAISTILRDLFDKEIPINIDGAVAAILCELQFPEGLGNAPFLISRFTSLLAHSFEEIEKMPRMRRIDPLNFGYSGPAAWEIPNQSIFIKDEELK